MHSSTERLVVISLFFLFINISHASSLFTSEDANNPGDTDDIHFSCNDPPIDPLIIPRSTIQIISSCVAATISCTWVAVHPNVEFRGHLGWMKRLLRRVSLVVLTLLAPELTVVWSAKQFNAARVIKKEINRMTRSIRELGHNKSRGDFELIKLRTDHEWTMVHAHFLQMGGFRLRCSEEDKAAFSDILVFHYEIPGRSWEGALTASAFKALIACGRLEFPDISKEEINDRSKGDWISKSIATLQINWFVIQTIVRMRAGLDPTAMEITTLFLCATNVITYSLWMDKPFNVNCPIVLRLLEPRNIGSGGAASLTVDDNDQEIIYAPWVGPLERDSCRDNVSLASSSNHAQGKSQNVYSLPILKLGNTIDTEETSQQEGIDSEYFAPYGSHRTGSEPQLAINPEGSNSRQEAHFRADSLIRTSSLPDLHPWPFSTAILHFLPWGLDAITGAAERRDYKPNSWKYTSQTYMETVLTTFYVSYIGPLTWKQHTYIASLVLTGVVRELFYVNLLKSFAFPSQIEQMIWKVAATSTGIPLFVAYILLVGAYKLNLGRWKNDYRHDFSVLWRVVTLFLFSIYCFARIILLVISITTLRHLSCSALQTINWLELIPHI